MTAPIAQRGFTLLEVLIAMLVIAVITAVVSQALHQTTQLAESERHRLPLILCARSLANHFELEHYWPANGLHQGRHDDTGTLCHWRMEVENTQVRQMRRGTLTLSTDEDFQHSLTFTLFLSP